MNFLNPFFLLGALAVTIPVVIHLINLRRPQKLPFPTLAFFEELKKSTLRKIRVKRYLLLALRILAVIMLALALARPLLTPSMGGAAGGSGDDRLSVLLMDNSPSMSRIGAGGPYFEQARDLAARIADNARGDDRFIVAGTNTPDEGLQHVNSARALDLLEEMEIVNTGNHLRQTVIDLANQLKNSTARQALIYLFTDAQQSQLEQLESLPDLDLGGERQLGIQFVKVGSSSQPNLAVSGIELQTRMLSRDNPVSLQVTVKNYGDAGAANHYVSLEVEGEMAGQYELNLAPGEERELQFEIVPGKVGGIAGQVVIEGDEIGFDNRRYFVLNIPRSRSVLLVDSDRQAASGFVSYLTPALEAARRSNTQLAFRTVSSEQVDLGQWRENDVIILNGLREIPEYWNDELQDYVQNGNGLLFFPSEQGGIENYNRFLGLFNAGSYTGINGEYASFRPIGNLAGLEQGHPVMEGIFALEEDEEIQTKLPELFYYYRFERTSATGSYTILSSSTGDPLLVEQRFGDGRLLVSALGTDPGWSNFPVNALFAPIFYRSVLYAAASEQGGLSSFELGRPFRWQGALEPGAEGVELRLNEVIYKPDVQNMAEGVSVEYSAREWRPGILSVEAGGAGHLVAVNQAAAESDFRAYTTDQLESLGISSVAITNAVMAGEHDPDALVAELRSAGMGWEIWNWFIWLALIILIGESLVSKLYRAESIT